MGRVAPRRPARLCATSRPRSHRALAKAALAAVVDGALVDLSCPLEKAPRSASSPTAARKRCRSTGTARAFAGGGGDAALPRSAVRHRTRDRRRFLLRLIVDRPFVPEDLDAIEKKMKDLAAKICPTSAGCGRGTSQGVLHEAGRAAEGAVDRRENCRTAEVSCYTIKDPETFIDFCVGPTSRRPAS